MPIEQTYRNGTIRQKINKATGTKRRGQGGVSSRAHVPDVEAQPPEPLADVVLYALVAVVDVGRGVEVLPRLVVALPRKGARAHRPLLPVHLHAVPTVPLLVRALRGRAPTNQPTQKGLIRSLYVCVRPIDAPMVDDDVRHGVHPAVVYRGDELPQLRLRAVRRVQLVQIPRQVPLGGDGVRGGGQPDAGEPCRRDVVQLLLHDVVPVVLRRVPVEALERTRKGVKLSGLGAWDIAK
eukprot:4431503-Pyramimonas_sp.AAC.1